MRSVSYFMRPSVILLYEVGHLLYEVGQLLYEVGHLLYEVGQLLDYEVGQQT